jgi:CrcB protein
MDLPLDPDLGSDEEPRGAHTKVRVTWGHLALVLAGGTVGTGLRELVTFTAPTVATVPAGTFTVNIVGAFALGTMVEALTRRGDDVGRQRTFRLLVGTGFMGGFTTYSALALEVADLLRNGDVLAAAAYGLTTVVLGAMVAWLGVVFATRLHERGERSAS